MEGYATTFCAFRQVSSIKTLKLNENGSADSVFSLPVLALLLLGPLGSLANASDNILEVIKRPTSETGGAIVRLRHPFSSILHLSQFQFF